MVCYIYYFLFLKIIKEKKVSWLSSNINRELTEENKGKNKEYTFHNILFQNFSFIPNRFLFIFQEQKRTTLLDFLFESSYEGEKYSEQDIRDEINTFAIAVNVIYYLLLRKFSLLNI